MALVDTQERGTSWLVLAGILLLILGLFNVVWGLAAAFDDPFVVSGADEDITVIGDINVWGWVIFALGVLQVTAAVSLGSRQERARWFGILVAGLAAIGHVGSLRGFEILSLIVIGGSVLVIYALASYGRRGAPTDPAVPWAGVFVDPDRRSQPAEVKLTQIRRKSFSLDSSLSYKGETGLKDPPTGARTVRPKHLPDGTDLTSVPRALQWFVSPYGVHTPAVLLHDRLIGGSGLSGMSDPDADRYFRFMLRELGVPWIRRWMMWAAVAIRTRWAGGRLKKATVALWALASLAGIGLAVYSIVVGEGLLLLASLGAPFVFALLWGRQYVAGLVAAVTSPWVLPPTLLGAVGFAVYWCLEQAALVVGDIVRVCRRQPPKGEGVPISYEQF